MQKMSSFHPFILEVQSILESCDQIDHTFLTFFTTPTPEFFDQLLIYVNLYQHEKNQAISPICSGDMID